MIQRQALLLTTFLTFFTLAVIGAVVGQFAFGSADETAAITEALPATATVTGDSTVDQDAVNALIASREQAYQGALNQANQQLQDAYAQLETQKATAAPPGSTTGEQAADTTPTYPVSAEQAGAVALAAMPGAGLNTTPELVDFEGTVAYEVNTSAGMIYVDATTGNVLFSGASVPAPATEDTSQIPSSAGQISTEQAAAAALAYVGDGTVASVESVTDNGKVYYLVGFQNGTQVLVDAESGAVVASRIVESNFDDEDEDAD